MTKIDINFLQKFGVHYGHLTHKRHPKFSPYIIGKKGGIHIIDLKKTLTNLKKAYDFVYQLASEGKKLLYICTKPYSQEIIEREARRSENFYINTRWLGGTLTNSVTIRQSINRLKDINELAGEDYRYEGMLKKEASKKEKERKKLHKLFQGIMNMHRPPSAVFIIDIEKEKIALNEVIKSNIPVIAVTDTNTNPQLVDYPIPGNDDSLKTIDLFCQVISAASISGRLIFDKKKQEQEKFKEEQKKLQEKAKEEKKKLDEKKLEEKKAASQKEMSKANDRKEVKDSSQKAEIKASDKKEAKAPSQKEVSKASDKKEVKASSQKEVSKASDKKGAKDSSQKEVSKASDKKEAKASSQKEVSKSSNKKEAKASSQKEVSKSSNKKEAKASSQKEVSKSSNKKEVKAPSQKEVSKASDKKKVKAPSQKEVSKASDKKKVKAPSQKEVSKASDKKEAKPIKKK